LEAEQMSKQYFVYILSSSTLTLYVGVTSNLPARIHQHRTRDDVSFTGRYNVWKLVYAEVYDDVLTAIAREKQIKRWSRAKKLHLIRSENPSFNEIAAM
jgi:putative endonuclease